MRCRWRVSLDGLAASTIFLAMLIGGLTFTGSIIAYGKLAGKVSQKTCSIPRSKLC